MLLLLGLRPIFVMRRASYTVAGPELSGVLRSYDPTPDPEKTLHISDC